MINPLFLRLLIIKIFQNFLLKFKQKHLTGTCIFRQKNIQIGHYTETWAFPVLLRTSEFSLLSRFIP